MSFEFIDKNHIKCLDHGYVKFVRKGGSDSLIDNFARTSFVEDSEPRTDSEIEGLISYLVEHRHTSPIEAGELWFELKMPIFVARQHMRHRTSSANEYSLRYAEQLGDYYLPELENIRFQDKWNKQGGGDSLPSHLAEANLSILKEVSEYSYAKYKLMVKNGVEKGLARCVLGTNFYTKLSWKMDTKNILHYLSLRDEGHAQYEIRQFAKAIAYFVKREFPKLYSAYEEYMRESKTFSRTEMKILRDLLSQSEDFSQLKENINDWHVNTDDNFDLKSKRRAKEFIEKLT